MRVAFNWLGVLTVALIGGTMTVRSAAATDKAAANPKAPAAKTPSALPANDAEIRKLLILTEAEPEDGAAPLKVHFKASVYEGDDPVKPKYLWVFGDGDTSQQQNPTHVYKKPGNYKVLVSVTDQPDRNGTDTLDIRVSPPDEE